MNTEAIIRTESLDYFFGEEKILKSLDLEVEKGTIHGFLGPNGAGKTTTIRLLLGLLRTKDKQVFLFNQDIAKSRKEILKKVGALVEMPALYPHLTAQENLEVTRKWLPWVNRNRITEVLEIVGLAHVAHKKIKKFSLGMKQRLGLALTLLPDPELLILDEPTNGLDPNGILEIRKLLIKLNQEYGKTVFVSSHLLGEIEKFVSHISIIHKGEMKFQGKLKELQSGYQRNLVEFQLNDAEAGKVLLESIGLEVLKSEEGLITLPANTRGNVHLANKKLVESGLEVYQIKSVTSDLEELFMGITENQTSI